MSEDSLIFRKEDCLVQGGMVDVVGGGRAKKAPRWGSLVGNTVDGRMGPDVIEDLKAVTVIHVPTGLSVTERDFLPARNKELAFIKLEKLVNEFIERMINDN